MRLLKIGLILGMVCLLSVPAAFARFYINPVDTSESAWLELVAAPGYEVIGDVVIFNGFDEATKFSLSVVDAESTEEEDGFFGLAAEGSTQSGIGLWGSLERDQITILSGESEVFEVSFVIPEDVELGHYWGGVTAMEVKDEVVSDESGLTIAVRNGLRVHVEVLSVEDYEAWLAAQNSTEEEPITEEEPLSIINYALLLQGGILVLILAILIAFLNYRKS